MSVRRRKKDETEAAAEPPASTTPLFDVVERALRDREWEFDRCGNPAEGIPAARMPVRGPHGSYLCVISANETTGQVLFTATHPSRFPRERLGALCEAVARANWGLIVPALELNLDEGELRARAGLDVQGGALTVPMVQSLIDATFQAFDWYYVAFMRVGFGSMAAADAILEAELGMLPGPADGDDA